MSAPQPFACEGQIDWEPLEPASTSFPRVTPSKTPAPQAPTNCLSTLLKGYLVLLVLAVLSRLASRIR